MLVDLWSQGEAWEFPIQLPLKKFSKYESFKWVFSQRIDHVWMVVYCHIKKIQGHSWVKMVCKLFYWHWKWLIYCVINVFPNPCSLSCYTKWNIEVTITSNYQWEFNKPMNNVGSHSTSLLEQEAACGVSDFGLYTHSLVGLEGQTK